MTREIKFRAWDKIGGEVMLDIYAIDFYSRRIQFGAKSDEWRNWDDSGDLVLMQFTGLKDKNGKEIYEGDVVKITERDTQTVVGEIPREPSLAKVFFKDGAFQTDFYNSLLRIALPGNWIVEIIGNIYEHPNLLNK